MKSIKKAELILKQLSNDPMYLHPLPQTDEMKDVLKIVVLSDPLVLNNVPTNLLSNPLICAAICWRVPIG